jgi:cell division protein FtsW
MLRLDSRATARSASITIAAAALLGVGVVMVFSASASLATPSPQRDTTTLEHGLALTRNPAVRQAMFTSAALVALLLVGLCPFQSWRIRSTRGPHGAWRWQPAMALLVVSLGLLVLVLVPGIGEQRNGARRWLPLGPSVIGLGFQPSEIAKVAIVIFLAAYSAHLGERIRRFWTGFLPCLLILAAFAGLVGVEDLGTGVLLAMAGACILIAAGARVWHLILAALPGAGGLVYLVLMKPYRLQRLASFLHPEADPQGAGYHQIQSLVTIASGGWWGQGLGAGVQKYGYLPEARTDFIFAVICEELGIIGGITILALFAVLLWQGRRAMLGAPDEFGRLLALGVSLMIGLQATMNVGVVTVSIPTKGIGLPLVSAGGTGVIFFAILVGLLVNVARRHPSPHPSDDRRRVRCADQPVGWVIRPICSSPATGSAVRTTSPVGPAGPAHHRDSAAKIG